MSMIFFLCFLEQNTVNNVFNNVRILVLIVKHLEEIMMLFCIAFLNFVKLLYKLLFYE